MGAGLRHVQGEWAGTAWPVHASDWRNGKSAKTVRTGDGPVRLAIPRDRDGRFEPILIPKHERRFTGFDDKIIAMYARGMPVREIPGILADQYGSEVSPAFESSLTDEVLDDVVAWQMGAFERRFTRRFCHATRLKFSESAQVREAEGYLAVG